MRHSDVIGKQFGNWSVMGFARRKGKIEYYKCKCKCNRVAHVNVFNLMSGSSKGCGCVRHKKIGIVRSYTNIRANYLSSANKRGIKFDLTVSDLESLIKQKCHYCGSLPLSPFNPYLKANGSPNRAYATINDKKYVDSLTIYVNGIDRYDNNIGYTLQNCVPCCWICNRAKLNLSAKVFNEWIERIKSFRL